jgi:hypothetical protein
LSGEELASQSCSCGVTQLFTGKKKKKKNTTGQTTLQKQIVSYQRPQLQPVIRPDNFRATSCNKWHIRPRKTRLKKTPALSPSPNYLTRVAEINSLENQPQEETGVLRNPLSLAAIGLDVKGVNPELSPDSLYFLLLLLLFHSFSSFF